MTVTISAEVLNEIAQWVLVVSLIPMIISSARVTNEMKDGYAKWKKGLNGGAKEDESPRDEFERIVRSDDPVVKQALDAHIKGCKRENCGIELMLKKMK